MSWAVIDRCEELGFKTCEPVAKKWSAWTGRSNFVLARWSLIVGLAMMVTFWLWRFTNDPSYILFASLNIAIMGWIGVRRYRFYCKVEESFESGNDTINVTPFAMHNYHFDRRFWTGYLVFFAVPVRLLTWDWDVLPIATALWVASHYFLVIRPPAGKSLAKRVVDAVKALGRRIKSMVPEPTPAPVPIPIRA